MTAPARSAEAFLDHLNGILRRDRRLGKSSLSHCREIALRLAPILWRGAVSARDGREKWDKDVWRETALAQADRVDALARHARRLLESLRRVEPHVREAMGRRYLPPGATQGPRPSSLFDLMNWGTAWSAAVQVRGSLQQLVREADAWASAARKDATGRRGPKTSRTKYQLSAWVAVQLADAGVWPTAAKGGTFARVLSIVQVIAGFPERSLEQIERDVRRALKHPTVVDYLGRLQKTTT